jgi:SAM-dependent methyltransferase
MADVYDRTFWDSFYEDAPAHWSGRPNPHLVTDAAALPPGAALDVGSGEGGDAIWLAERGWRVTAVDISQVALDRASIAAGDQASRITFEQHDVLAWTPAPDGFDLVSAQYLHFPTPQMHALVQGLATAVRPGGTLLIVGHAITDHRPFPPEFFYTGDELAALLPDGWEVVSATDRAHPHREGLDSVLNARRTA